MKEKIKNIERNVKEEVNGGEEDNEVECSADYEISWREAGETGLKVSSIKHDI